MARITTWAAVALLLGACGDSGPGELTGADGDQLDALAAADVAADVDAGPQAALPFPEDFRFGAAVSAHQVEGHQDNTWTAWETLPQFADFVVEPSGAAADHLNRYEEDFDLAAWMGLDTVRFSMEWSRAEPERGVWSEDGFGHYDAVLDALVARGLTPSVTLHHFTEPPWFVDLAALEAPFDESFCPDGPTETRYCSWLNPDAPSAFAAWCGQAAARYGDRVDEWWTINELLGVWTGGFVSGDFPPGLSAWDQPALDAHGLPALRNIIEAHVLCYDAIHLADTVDADGDGVPARVGITMGTGAIRPADPDNPDDVAATEQAVHVANHAIFDAVTAGELDVDFDLVPDEPHPDWADHLDLIGVQYYASTVVVGVSVHPLLWGTPCMDPGDEFLRGLLQGAGCPPPPEGAAWPFADGEGALLYGRQHDPDGMVEVLADLADRYPGVPLVVTEQGFANDDAMRARSVVTHVAAAHAALAADIPLEGYYHWSLLDNFEWGRGFDVRFGLVAVDFDDEALPRAATQAADVYRDITTTHGPTQALLDAWPWPWPASTE